MTPDVSLTLPTAARDIYETVRALPIVSPHGHCDPGWFASDAAFDNPAALLVVPDHYVFRMLYSLGVDLTDLGIGAAPGGYDPRRTFQILADHWDAFLGTPSHLWMAHVLAQSFGVGERLTSGNAMDIYDRIAARLDEPSFRPRALLAEFDIEVLATTDGALDDLGHHRTIAAQDVPTRIIPTFRPDAVLNPDDPGFADNVNRLAQITDTDISGYSAFLTALRQRRAFFKDMGATATDHAISELTTEWLAPDTCETLFDKARRGALAPGEGPRLYGHLLIEMAQMSCDDGLVMQLHAGSRRGTNQRIKDRFGADMGADIPRRTDWVGGLDALLNRVGNDARFRLIAFTLDESSYARELAPMAGHWPALRLGPPWWFHDSLNGILRYFDQVVETAGYRNLAGFNDDTRAFLSIPARHDLWRRAVSLHLAGQIGRGLLNAHDANRLARLLSRDLAVDAYRLEGGA